MYYQLEMGAKRESPQQVFCYRGGEKIEGLNLEEGKEQ